MRYKRWSSQEPAPGEAYDHHTPQWHSWRRGRHMPTPMSSYWRHYPRPMPPFTQARYTYRPGRVFARLMVAFGAFIVLVGGALTLLVNLVQLALGTDQSLHKPYLLIGIGVLLLLSFATAAIRIGRRNFRTIASPLADLLSAAEAVKDGDLSVRVPETNSRHFSGVANTFNEMVASLERADQQRRNLTADVAHELRTPLQIIQGNLEGVLDGVYEPTNEHIEATLEATHQLARLVEDLRTLSLAESGQLTLEFEPVDVGELLLDTQTSFSGLAESAGITLRVAAPDKPLFIHGDPGRLDQVMTNLVVNAVRHTPRDGTITLETASVPEGVEIRVRDTGEGIAPEDLPFIFDRFWRGDRARTHQEGVGSGLGLAITRQLVRLHGGTIDVASTLGTGTTFTIRLPEMPAASPGRKFYTEE